MNEFMNVWFDWLFGYAFVILTIAGFSVLIIKTFTIKERSKRWIVIAGVFVALNAAFIYYYHYQTSRIGYVTKITVADDFMFVEGVLTSTGYQESKGSASRYREDISTTTHSQKIFVFDKRNGKILKRIEDYQVAHHSDHRAFLVPTNGTKSYSVLNCRTLGFDRFFNSDELIAELPEYSGRIDKISYDRTWILKPDVSTSGWKPAMPYFQVTLDDGSQFYYDVLTGKTTEWSKPGPLSPLYAFHPKISEYEDFTVDSSDALVLMAVKKRQSKNGFVLYGKSPKGPKKWTLTADQIDSKINEDAYFFSENPGTYMVDENCLYFFTERHAVSVDINSGKLLWVEKI